MATETAEAARAISPPSEPEAVAPPVAPATPEYPYRKYLPYVRILLAASGLIYSAAQPRFGMAYLIAGGVYLLYAVAVAIKGLERSNVFNLLGLFADTIYFLVLINQAENQTSLWVPAIFYLYLLNSGVAQFSVKEIALVVTLSMGFCMFVRTPLSWLMLRTIVVGGFTACAFALHRRRIETLAAKLRQAVKDAHEASVNASAAERQRIAADFHDGPLQSFISFQMRLEILKRLFERDQSAGMEELQQLQQLSQVQIRQLRSFVRSMRPVELDSANLAAAIRRITEDFQKESGIQVTFVASDVAFTTGQETAADILQMVREALHNVLKHAHATRVAVSMEKTGRKLDISIDDNGAGFEFSGAYTLEELEMLRLGPVSLKQRARSLNAEMFLESRPGRGAGLKLRIPV